MRYEDWDVLLFPGNSNVPFKEFGAVCKVVRDQSFYGAAVTPGVPTVACFVPSLQPGAPFTVSVHTWSPPKVSRFTKSLSKHHQDVKFEARLMIDGQIIMSAHVGVDKDPYVFGGSSEMLPNNTRGWLEFPSIKHDVLQQKSWNVGDELGRIKVVICEGFPRNSPSLPMERVNNIVAFSFQYVPIDILESCGIAWPNPSMWQGLQTNSAPSSEFRDDLHAHAHSPRRCDQSTNYNQLWPHGIPPSDVPPRSAQHQNSGSGTMLSGAHEATVSPYFDWMGFMGKSTNSTFGFAPQYNAGLPRAFRASSTDISMPDYVPSHRGSENEVGQVPQRFSTANYAYEDELQSGRSKVPTNTPTATWGSQELSMRNAQHGHAFPHDLATALTVSLLNQPPPDQVHQQSATCPATEIKSRKETRIRQQTSAPVREVSISTVGQGLGEMRRVSQQLSIPPGATAPTEKVPSNDGTPKVPRTTHMSNLQSPNMDESGTEGDGRPRENITPLRTISGNSLDKGAKRTRNFTPASAKAIDEEDEPQRASPRVRLMPFVEDTPDHV